MLDFFYRVLHPLLVAVPPLTKIQNWAFNGLLAVSDWQVRGRMFKWFRAIRWWKRRVVFHIYAYGRNWQMTEVTDEVDNLSSLLILSQGCSLFSLMSQESLFTAMMPSPNKNMSRSAVDQCELPLREHQIVPIFFLPANSRATLTNYTRPPVSFVLNTTFRKLLNYFPSFPINNLYVRAIPAWICSYLPINIIPYWQHMPISTIIHCPFLKNEFQLSQTWLHLLQGSCAEVPKVQAMLYVYCHLLNPFNPSHIFEDIIGDYDYVLWKCDIYGWWFGLEEGFVDLEGFGARFMADVKESRRSVTGLEWFGESVTGLADYIDVPRGREVDAPDFDAELDGERGE